MWGDAGGQSACRGRAFVVVLLASVDTLATYDILLD